MHRDARDVGVHRNPRFGMAFPDPRRNTAPVDYQVDPFGRGLDVDLHVRLRLIPPPGLGIQCDCSRSQVPKPPKEETMNEENETPASRVLREEIVKAFQPLLYSTLALKELLISKNIFTQQEFESTLQNVENHYANLAKASDALAPQPPDRP